ncbi:hypothetical protein Cni_G12416 [Canna indica]|uniref:Uncharacterized protein n=1 Tax=Canna indica TaxID=4628 RepID=A0AAQ3Q902_9LILI|nr:hypothetical protein Cni_G12416 [Canna indica]
MAGEAPPPRVQDAAVVGQFCLCLLVSLAVRRATEGDGGRSPTVGDGHGETLAGRSWWRRQLLGAGLEKP